ncbi:MAG TPA: hypothetical protein VH866_02475 [Candidatus Deferrimicrobiaceae bacterium]
MPAAVMFALFCLAAQATATHASTIVGIRTPAEAVIAADSLGTSRGNRIESTQLVCKIFTVNGAGFAIGGLTKDLPWEFDAEGTVSGILGRRSTMSGAVNDISERLAGMLGSYLGRMKRRDPSLYAKTMKGEDGFITSVLLASYEDGQPVAAVIGFRGSEDPAGNVNIDSSRAACPGDCPNGTMYFFLGERGPIDRHIAEHGKGGLLPAATGAPFLVQLVIDGGSKRVGPPVDVLVIDRHGESWPARKPGCTGDPGRHDTAGQ